MSKPLPAKYRTTNRKSDNIALRHRGSLMIWLDKGLLWQGQAKGKPGRPPSLSDGAILFCLTTKCLFGRPLRQVMGFVESLLKLPAGQNSVSANIVQDRPISGAPAETLRSGWRQAVTAGASSVDDDRHAGAH
ncbi:transposase [Crenobacter sp. SG2303]|uniref:Transposase n=1 Tax=Crenobacter oryzisoli TaxID=3056844 RepID=A0ABT7XSE1_9NEIS|nr:MULTISPECIES: transposase [unclassified Crenobacter]MDN0076726.1 transposase [Crenobacter sp. SG2303]MDN0085565.1 transposase [Crenobacter sp. SG2305]